MNCISGVSCLEVDEVFVEENLWKGKKMGQAPIYVDGQMGKEKPDEGSGQGWDGGEGQASPRRAVARAKRGKRIKEGWLAVSEAIASDSDHGLEVEGVAGDPQRQALSVGCNAL